MRKLLIIAIIAMLAMTACPTDSDDGGGSSIPNGIKMTTTRNGTVQIYLTGTDIIINWGDDVIDDIGDSDSVTPITHNYTITKARTITITGDIERLSCDNLVLTHLDVRAATALIYLSCTDNKLTKLDLSRNKALQSLYCNSNNLTSLTVNGADALLQINCAENKMNTAALNALFYSLPPRESENKGTIVISGNDGVVGSDPTIATAKYWVVNAV